MADISPELAEKIRELSARHEENPGRFFVPLANALRDAGEIGQAEELLRSGLKRHPGYLSAHIVLGRCLADRGAVEEAAVEFRHVLSVDPQNLIALRTMGEMTSAAGRGEEAARWYRELLAVDPMNKEARDALDAVESPASASAAPGHGDLDPGFGLVDVDTGGQEAAAPAAEFGMVDPDAYAAPSADAHPAPPAGEFGVVDLDAAPPAAEADEPAAPPVDFGSWGEVSLDADAAAAEPKAGDRMREYDDFSFGDVELGADGAPAPRAAAAPDDLPAGPPLQISSFAEPAHEDDEEVVTETMAELYARQGFHDRAVDVYRELLRRRGDEPALVRRLAELETMAEKEAAQGESAVIETPPLTPADLHADAGLPVIETGLPGLNFSGGLPFEPAADEATLAFGAEVPPLEGLTFETPGTVAPAPDAGVREGSVLGFESFENLGASLAGEPPAPPAPAEPAAPDAFAQSFAHGFSGAPAEAASASPAAPAASEAASPPQADAPPSAPASEESHPTAAESQATSVVSYLAALLAWRPTGQAAAPPAVPSPAAALEAEQRAAFPIAPEEPAVDAPPAAAAEPVEDLPWMSGPAAEAPAEPASPPASEPADEPAPWDAAPWDAPAEAAAPEPAAAAEPAPEPEPFEVSSLGFDLPAPAAGEPTVQEPASGAVEEPLPWELGSADAPPPPPAVPEAPRQDPAPVEGGFSFEDFFSAPTPQAAAPAPLPSPEPAPAEPAPGAAPAAGGEDDEDLESFQAWLQSLKR